MRKITKIISLTLIAAAVLAPAASARARKAHHYISYISENVAFSGNGYPAAGGTAVIVGTWRLYPHNNGALVDAVEITGQPASDTFTFKGNEFDVLPRGVLKSTFSGTAKVNPDGTLAVTAAGTFNGGTGLYKGATGSYQFTGKSTQKSATVTGSSKGTFVY